MRPKIVAIIQARMNSSRLPGKVLMHFSDKSMLAVIIDRVSSSKLIDELIVATTVSAADDAISQLCDSLAVKCFRGAEDQVLDRFIHAAQAQCGDIVVRLTGDNPFVDGKLVDILLQEFLRHYPKVDYCSNIDNCGFPFGLFVEVLKIETLLHCAIDATAEEQEHVTLRVRKSPKDYVTRRCIANYDFSNINLSVDTLADRRRTLHLFDILTKINPQFSLHEISLVGPNYLIRDKR